MPTFRYIARDDLGADQGGTLVADSEPAAVRMLDDRGLYTVGLWEQEVTVSTLAISRRVKLADLSGFYNQLGDLLGGGVPMLRALDVLSRQKAGFLGAVLRELREDVAGGAALADAMDKHTLAFPELHVGMVRAGEQGGFLEPVLHRLALFVEQRDQLRSKIIGSMIYPVFLLVAGLTVVLVVTTYFMPKLQPLFEGTDLPVLTTVVMAFANGLRTYFWLVLLGLLLAATVTLPYLRSTAGRRRLDRAWLRAPVVGPIFLMLAVCRFSRVLGTLLTNGVPMLDALNISQESAGNSVVADVIADAAEAVRSGKSLAQTLQASDLFPADIVDIIAVAEQTNTLDKVLVDLAERHEQRISRKVDTAVRMLEPVMLLIVFAMVVVIAMALLLPILRMSFSGVTF